MYNIYNVFFLAKKVAHARVIQIYIHGFVLFQTDLICSVLQQLSIFYQAALLAQSQVVKRTV